MGDMGHMVLADFRQENEDLIGTWPSKKKNNLSTGKFSGEGKLQLETSGGENLLVKTLFRFRVCEPFFPILSPILMPTTILPYFAGSDNIIGLVKLSIFNIEAIVHTLVDYLWIFLWSSKFSAWLSFN